MLRFLLISSLIRKKEEYLYNFVFVVVRLFLVAKNRLTGAVNRGFFSRRWRYGGQ